VAAEHDLQVDEILLLKAGSIPKTTSNKIQRNECRKRYLKNELTIVHRWPAAEKTAAQAADAEQPSARLSRSGDKRILSPRPSNGNGAARSGKAADLKTPGT